MDTKIGWGEAKEKLYTSVNAVISPLRDKYNELLSGQEIEKILHSGSVKARECALETIEKVRAAVGVL
jgi:tryptophanyl-tRNA synthetase